jgi:transcription elongation factor Elf1
MAIEALEKQMPKKPIETKEMEYCSFYDCPSCEGRLVSKIDGEWCAGQLYKYCYRCGQKLDWSINESV